jgi:antitoxin component YwqK of YwqJK toxin-antitoxin module
MLSVSKLRSDWKWRNIKTNARRLRVDIAVFDWVYTDSSQARAMTDWYYGRKGQHKGPVAVEQLQKLIGSGRALPTDLAWHEGMGDWTAIRDIQELSASVTEATANVWYYGQNDEQQGPASLLELRKLIAAGTVGHDWLAWKDGMGEWAAISTLAPFAGVKASPKPSETQTPARPPVIPARKTVPPPPPVPTTPLNAAASAAPTRPPVKPARKTVPPPPPVQTTQPSEPADQKLHVGWVMTLGLVILLTVGAGGYAIWKVAGNDYDADENSQREHFADAGDDRDGERDDAARPDDGDGDGAARHSPPGNEPAPKNEAAPKFVMTKYEPPGDPPPPFDTVDYSQGPNGEPIKKGEHTNQKGVIVYEKFYINSKGEKKRHGIILLRMPTGQRLWEYFSKEELVHGPSRKWHSDNGQLAIRGAYIRGYKHGLWEHWYEDGTPALVETWDNRNLNGLATVFHENGLMKIQLGYREGKENGSFYKWWENGQLRNSGSYVDGAKDAKWNNWREDGTRVSEVSWKLGALAGKETQWSRDGKVTFQKIWDADRGGLLTKKGPHIPANKYGIAQNAEFKAKYEEGYSEIKKVKSVGTAVLKSALRSSENSVLGMDETIARVGSQVAYLKMLNYHKGRVDAARELLGL